MGLQPATVSSRRERPQGTRQAFRRTFQKKLDRRSPSEQDVVQVSGPGEHHVQVQPEVVFARRVLAAETPPGVYDNAVVQGLPLACGGGDDASVR